ncbi:MAG: methionyl-tRNA formyltransferase [Patescibacteria group bacterium]
MNTNSQLPAFIFFGTDEFAVTILGELKRLGPVPELIITTPDHRGGRDRSPAPPVKLWAEENKISCRQPSDLKFETNGLEKINAELFVVASYGQIIPPEIIARPRHGILNVHPSLLPKFRGSTPIQSAILAGAEETGVTIMLLDEQVDHGPILQSESYELVGKNYLEARDSLAKLGAELLFEVIPKWINGEIVAKPQDHAQATFTKKIKKEDGEINLATDPELNYRKFLAYQSWPGIYFFINHAGRKIRVLVTDAKLENGRFLVTRVKPEGRNDMSWNDFERGFNVEI